MRSSVKLRTMVAFALLIGTCLPGLPAGAAGPSTPVAPAAILAAPEQYEGRQVVIEGKATRVTRSAFPNGRRYYTFSVGNESASLTAFSWTRPPVAEGDRVRLVGVFHAWRYNLRHMVESGQITRLAKSP